MGWSKFGKAIHQSRVMALINFQWSSHKVSTRATSICLVSSQDGLEKPCNTPGGKMVLIYGHVLQAAMARDTIDFKLFPVTTKKTRTVRTQDT